MVTLSAFPHKREEAVHPPLGRQALGMRMRRPGFLAASKTPSAPPRLPSSFHRGGLRDWGDGPLAPGSILCETECVYRCRGSTHVQYAHIKRELELLESTGARCSLWFFNPLNLSTGAHCFWYSRTDFTEGQEKPNKPCGLNILLIEQTLC